MRRGDLTTPVLMWFVGIVTAIILVTWYMKSSSFNELGLSAIDEDLKNIHYDLSVACSNQALQSNVRLYTKKGNLRFNDSSLCIMRPLAQGNLTRCLPAPCNLGVQVSMDIESISTVRIEKDLDAAGDPIFTILGQ